MSAHPLKPGPGGRCRDESCAGAERREAQRRRGTAGGQLPGARRIKQLALELCGGARETDLGSAGKGGHFVL